VLNWLLSDGLLNDTKRVNVGVVRLFALATVLGLVPGLLERSGMVTSSRAELIGTVKRGVSN